MAPWQDTCTDKNADELQTACHTLVSHSYTCSLQKCMIELHDAQG